MQSNYALVRLRNGTFSVRSIADDETFHPGIGPVAEAETLYVRQLHLPELVAQSEGEFVLWDVGLGAAANALTALKHIRERIIKPTTLRLISFDQTSAAAEFALQHATELGYVSSYESALTKLVNADHAAFRDGNLQVEWTLILGDFPGLLRSRRGNEAQIEIKSEPPCIGRHTAAPHAILFDPHSPQKNPALWTVSLFENLFSALDPNRPCSLATFTRSTMARAAMLLGGFFVGVGHPSGLKEETTVAANRIELLDEPLDRRWLDRAKRSDSAEPLLEPIYRRAKLSAETWEQLRSHPQFK